MSDLALIKSDDLSLVPDNLLNEEQLKILLKKTPSQYVKARPAKGGGTWNYVTGGYVRKVLNLLFGWKWSFEIVDEQILLEAREVVVKGRLTAQVNGTTITKMQYGNKDIICKRGTDTPLSIGNDLKAAATDCLKKCAAEIGIAADIYNAEDFREVKVQTELDELKELFEWVGTDMDIRLKDQIQGVIDRKEKASYAKCISQLKGMINE